MCVCSNRQYKDDIKSIERAHKELVKVDKQLQVVEAQTNLIRNEHRELTENIQVRDLVTVSQCLPIVLATYIDIGTIMVIRTVYIMHVIASHVRPGKVTPKKMRFIVLDNNI